MAYPSNSDSVAQDQIAAFIERIMRMREEAKAIKDDIREIYAEAKGAGFDKTILGKLVSYIEKRATSSAELEEGEALFDLYLSAYDSATGKVGTRVATHTHERFPSNGGEAKVIRSSRTGADEPAGGVKDSGARENGLTAPPIQFQAPDTGRTQGADRELAGQGTDPTPAYSDQLQAVDAATVAVGAGESVVALPAPLSEPEFNSHGQRLPRMPGCLNTDCCAGMWNRRCHGCERAFTGHQVEREAA